MAHNDEYVRVIFKDNAQYRSVRPGIQVTISNFQVRDACIHTTSLTRTEFEDEVSY